MHRFILLTGHFLLAVFSTFVLASLSHTQFVLFGLAELNVAIDLATRLNTSWQDLIGLSVAFAPMILIALLIAFVTMNWLSNKIVKSAKGLLFIVGGALAMGVMLIAMFPIFEITLIAGARSTAGVVCQCLAGAFGGWIFHHKRSQVSYTSPHK